MKKNKLYALLIIAFVLLVPLNFAFLSIEENEGVISLFMMVIIELLVVGALILGAGKSH
jgi:hypothetical protein